MKHGFGGSCRHLLTLLLLLTLGLTLLSAQALPARALGAHLTLSPTSGPPTTQVTVQGSGFGSQERVTITFAGTLVASATTNRRGQFTATVRVPAAASPGTHPVQAMGQTSGWRAQARFLVQTNWPMFGFDLQHSSDNPDEHVLNPSNVSQLTLDWSAPVGTAGQLLRSSPVIANGMIYVNDALRYLDAFDAATGTLRWQYTIFNILPFSTPVVADGIVYIGTENNFTAMLYALNARTGALIWSYYNESLGFSTPTVANGILYAQAGCAIYAFNAYTGTLLWSVGAGGAVVNTAAAVANGVLYGLVCNAFDFYMLVEALNAQTGAVLWNVPLLRIDGPGITNYYASLSVAKGVVYILGPNATTRGPGEALYALDARTGGALLWKAGLDGGPEPFPLQATPAVAKGVVYIGAQTGTLFAFDALTGRLRWSYMAAQSGLIESAPAVANGVVYVGSVSYGPPRTAQFGHLSALDAQTGKLLWHYDRWNGPGWPNGTFTAVVVNGMVYAFTYGKFSNNRLLAFHLPSTSILSPVAS